jgi:hypothetical protein
LEFTTLCGPDGSRTTAGEPSGPRLVKNPKLIAPRGRLAVPPKLIIKRSCFRSPAHAMRCSCLRPPAHSKRRGMFHAWLRHVSGPCSCFQYGNKGGCLQTGCRSKGLCMPATCMKHTASFGLHRGPDTMFQGCVQGHVKSLITIRFQMNDVLICATYNLSERCLVCIARCCSIVLPLQVGPSGFLRGPREVHHTYESTTHGGPSAHGRRGAAGTGASMCGVFICMRHLPGRC